MKKAIILLMIIGLIAGSISTAEAKKKKKPKPVKVERTVDFEYVCPCTGLLQLGTAIPANLGGGAFSISTTEVYLTAVATDTTGQAVPVDINQDTDGDGDNDAVGSFCGETAVPMPINAGLDIRVFVGLPLSCPTPAVLAGGTITFTLSNMP